MRSDRVKILDEVDWQPLQIKMPEMDKASQVDQPRELLTAGVVQFQGRNSGEETLQIFQIQER